MSENAVLTGKPSVDRPWMKFYPDILKNIHIPECTLEQYLRSYCRSMDIIAINYYGGEIPWSTVFSMADTAAKAMQALGVKEGDEIPVFLRSVPEFLYLLLAAEKLGASLLCRDNTLQENIEATQKANAKIVFVHDFFSQVDLNEFRAKTGVEHYIIVPALQSGCRDAMPDYIQNSLDALYPEVCAGGEGTMTWNEFCALGNSVDTLTMAPQDINRPLFRAYTSGSTGPSKQVIHSANSMIGIIAQMNFYGGSNKFRPTWMTTILPPALVAAVVSMMLLPLASGMLLILNPFVDVNDVDLELMRLRPNNWPLIPMFIETVMRNGRIPDDYDMSHLLAAGAGCEAYNNKQMDNAEQFLHAHNCNIRLTTGYGCSEAGSNVTLPMTPFPIRNGNVGVAMPNTMVCVFKPGTDEECGYNEPGELCKWGPGNMLGYDDPEATAKALKLHRDGRVWLHLGDIGYMTEDGVIYTMTRGESPRYGGGDLMIQPLENHVADANIKGIKDEFFVIVPDDEHKGYFLPYLYVVLEDGCKVDDIRDQVNASLPGSYMRPVDIFSIEERPFFHFKTNRLGLSKEIQAMRKQAREKAKRQSVAQGCTA